MKEEVNEPIEIYGKEFNYAEYLTWKVKERIELIKGRLFKMSPAPARIHQRISRDMQFIMMKYFGGHDCELYNAPFDVRLVDKKEKSKKDEDITTVFQPDLCVICNKEKLDDRGCIGAPDLIVEILSPGNSIKEMKYKYDLYEENGVREYWVVDYTHQLVYVYVLKSGVYKGKKPYTVEETAESTIFPDLKFDLKDIFKEED
ncbi:MAG: Uma2 family endonuclease [Chitinophagales bacterium]|nr:Uma2 family endonuclease [Chitinophagales bacterium]